MKRAAITAVTQVLISTVTALSPLSLKIFLLRTVNAVSGSTRISMYTRIFSGITRLSLAPKDEPMMAAIIEGTAIFQLIRPSFINLTVETVVPQALDSLLVAMAV